MTGTDPARLIEQCLSEHVVAWDEMGRLIEADDNTDDATRALAVTACASASSVGMAVALAWVVREFPERADELAALVMHYVDNGGDDDELLARYWPERQVSA
jgi:hypothetical protein